MDIEEWDEAEGEDDDDLVELLEGQREGGEHDWLFKGTETVSWRLSLQMAWMEMDWNFQKLANFFKFWCYLFQKSLRNLLWLALSDKIHLISSSQLCRSILFMIKTSK